MSLKDRLTGGMKINRVKEDIILEKKPSSVDVSNLINVLDALLIDENINTISINGAKNVYLERKGNILKSTVSFRDNIQLTNLILKLAKESGIEEDSISSYMNFNYKPGINIKAVFPPICNIPSIFIKCYHDKIATVKNFQDTGIISKELSLIFEALAQINYNIIIAGESNSFKTSILSSIAKLTPINQRGAIFDNQNEIKNNSFSIFNMSNLNDNICSQIVQSAIDSNLDKIFLNDKNDTLLPYFINFLKSSSKGLVSTICASSKEEAMDKITKIIQDKMSLNHEQAKSFAYANFDLIIFCKKDKDGKRRITHISEIENDNENNTLIKDIFVLKKTEDSSEEHASTGIIPKFYELAKEIALPVNQNIFIDDYKHTYSIVQNELPKNNLTSTDVLKKFKKDLNQQYDLKDRDNNLAKKAQEKFEELKKIAKTQEEENGLTLQDNEETEKNATIQEINDSLNFITEINQNEQQN